MTRVEVRGVVAGLLLLAGCFGATTRESDSTHSTCGLAARFIEVRITTPADGADAPGGSVLIRATVRCTAPVASAEIALDPGSNETLFRHRARMTGP
jgi:hypothetical protein